MVKRSDKRENIVFLSIGTNLGDRISNILNAKQALQKLTHEGIAMSRIYETEPWGNEALKPFLNSVIRISTVLEPLELLRKTQQLEIQIGRKAKSVGRVYANRRIDIDILTYNNLTYTSSELTIPHSLITQRNFVLKPFAELAPEYRLPYSMSNLNELIEKCKDHLKCSPLKS